ncbi:4'-phosphopantetheinyl transferase family protein [Psychromonas antarctica]|uniref:4'-phosphopantetheinyl transferase family protein n=1 Tax=Psychromonas antarctica TaxID=67573 RepID=UPI001EE9346F|nr:4'-phosphopantetheinyl transferase superfamily protein [Psychromonas antarctica]
MLNRDLDSTLKLQYNDIHLWIINPQDISDPTRLCSLKKLLTPFELAKTERYLSPSAQHNALITRAFVRLVLSQYAPILPHDWIFDINDQGKPELKTPPLALRFNLSHNNDLVVCAVCLDHDIGCDVESLRRKISIDAISKRYFSTIEYQNIKKLPPSRQSAQFFKYWTLKEAFVKATGFGISQGLDTFSFEIGESETAKFNDNICVSFSSQYRIKQNNNWYSCLTYPDPTHCVAICINAGNKKTDFTLQQFFATDHLSEFKNI